MRRYVAAYGLWLLGVLSAALIAYYYYRTYVLPLGQEELEKRLSPHSPPSDSPGDHPAAGGPPTTSAEA